MRWLSSFALMLYLSLLCTPQAFAVHDAWLSPLADTQFHAVTPEIPQCTSDVTQDGADEPQPVLPVAGNKQLPHNHNHAVEQRTSGSRTASLTLQQARAPPVFFSQFV